LSVVRIEEEDMKIEVVVGNIVMQSDVDALVNSANANLRLGSGVAGAIHTAAGPELEKFCQPFAPLELGAALITPGFKLANPWVIHVRAAHYILNTEPERYMAFAMFSMLNTAKDNGIRSLAMPAIGTGVFKFPPMLAARITAKALREFEKKTNAIDLVRICVVSEDLRQQYESAVALEGKP
jgi:O-acetyl-ADP-ribose deacetylase (regulator of RNase III)